MSRPVTRSQYLIRAPDLFPEIFFTKFSGLSDKTNTDRYVSPILHREYQIPTHRTHAPITLDTPFYPERHSVVLDAWKNYTNKPLRIEVEPVKCGPRGYNISYGYRYQFTGCIWIGLTVLEADKSSNDISPMNIQFTYTDVNLL